IVWLRAGDMRLTDNPALHAAAESGNPVIPVFIQPPRCEEGGWPLAGAAAYWLHHSLVALQHSLSRLGSAVVVRRAADCGGSSAAALAALAAESGSRRVYYNASFEPWLVRRDEALEQELASQGVRAKRCAGNVLYHPEDARPDERTAAHGFGSVGFFLAAVATLPPPPPPLPPPRRLKPPAAWPHSLPLSELGYGRLPVRPDGTVEDWAAGIRRSWAVGEIGAQRALEAFVSGGIQRFEGRERFRADQANTAAISPHLRFGELSARAVLHSVRERASAPTFLRRLAWRDLAYWALWRFPHLPSRPFRPWFEAQAWSSDQPALEAWQAGATGFPLVDAAMAQLWATGWMPNYMRHVVAGFLVEFLNLDWRRFSLPVPRHGLRWFDYTLVDADTAINAYMWQNGGHSGMDQWNFVMHPVFAAKSCDPEGDYVRRWLPQLAALPVEYIHCPWEAPFALRAAAGVVLGGNYPKRILDDLEAARRASHAAVMAVR
ncbi:Deoxyribodipyrimidine photolyase/cryptochrome, partial [Emiliania huxleyi CCMP1516]|uniref:Photolyase/cryptochrome alpha/beta domain-containing protein n=2 Tax=Emiliania huxleyi TaxID=2903 RepID=A0A0D3K7K3_EMIH1